ncbi:pirin family protein [Proteobacteria bacterium 005FR1]|nr:pirin family protein [Proteobacteria bacterium 005FR1]
MSSANSSRNVEQIVNGIPTSDGAGVSLLRVLTQNLQRRLDPFLMLDEFRSDDPRDYIAGFPTHPHRGFQTVTYMLAGRMRHRDSAGNEGLLSSGGVQWMNAGRGLVHSELPEQEEGLMHGFQLWINLPSTRKMSEPGYRDIPSSEIPEITTESGVGVRVIAGETNGVKGAVDEPDTQPLYLDLHFAPGQSYSFPIPAGHNAFLYVYEGSFLVGEKNTRVNAQQMAVLSNEAHATGLSLHAKEHASALLLAGKPLREDIVQWGPFVMNTREEVEQALADYREGRFS